MTRHSRSPLCVCGSLVLLLFGSAGARAQTVQVVETNADQSALLQAQPPVGFET
jgi:hypothetical protein